MIQTDLKTALANHAGLNALVEGRIFPVVALQGTEKPYVTYHIEETAFQGASHDDAWGLAEPKLQVIAWALTYPAAWAVAMQIEAALKEGLPDVSPVDRKDGFDPEAQVFSVTTELTILE